MPYQFGDYLLHPATRELSRDGQDVALPARVFDCLLYLVEHRERAIGRDELIAAVWGRAEVSETLLNHTIVKLRRALGDSGSEQRSVRTVPRFGYRWELPTQWLDEPAPAAASLASSPPEPVTSMDDPAPARDAVAPPPSPRRADRWRPWLTASLLTLAVILAGGLWLRTHQAAPEGPGAASTVAPTPTAPVQPALVLPAVVDAPEQWQWLRLGLMDLVAQRLREGTLPTASSESVVTLLRQHAAQDGAALLHDPALVRVATLRVLPRARRVGAGWEVQLEAAGSQRNFVVDGQGADVMVAARAAADALLRQYGHAPGLAQAPRPVGLDELLQRSGAAMLADQLDQARALVTQAPLRLQELPEVEQRLAQIDLRSGDHAAVEARLRPLLDGPTRMDDGLRARIVLVLAAAYARQNRLQEAAPLYEQAIALGTPRHDQVVLGVARLGRGAVLAQSGQFEEARATLLRARLELAGIGDSLGVAAVDVNLGDVERLRHRPAAALIVLKTAVREFDQLGAREGRAYALTRQVQAELELLDTAAALATSELGWPAEAQTANRRIRWSLVLARAAALAANGRQREARMLLARIDSEAHPQHDASARAGAALLAARLDEQAGDHAAALRQFDAALVPSLCDGEPVPCARGHVQAIGLLLAAGRHEEARARLAALRAAATARSDWQAMLLALAQAQLAQADGAAPAARGHCAEAQAQAQRLGVPEDLVGVGVACADVLLAEGDADAARAALGAIALWTSTDLRVAQAEERLHRALGEDAAALRAAAQVRRLRGDVAGDAL